MIKEACKYEDPELFFPLGYGEKFQPQIQEALKVCGLCLDQADCLNQALTTPEKYGIWGGTTEEQRRSLVGGYSKEVTKRCYGCELRRPRNHFRYDHANRHLVGKCAGCENRPVEL